MTRSKYLKEMIDADINWNECAKFGFSLFAAYSIFIVGLVMILLMTFEYDKITHGAWTTFPLAIMGAIALTTLVIRYFQSCAPSYFDHLKETDKLLPKDASELILSAVAFCLVHWSYSSLCFGWQVFVMTGAI